MNKFVAVPAGLVAAGAMFLLGSYIEYAAGLPFAAMPRASSPPPAPLPLPLPGVSSGAEVPIVSRVQGAQDAARADVPMGEKIDLQRCYTTMVARKLPDTEARTVCAKLIGGISH